MAINDEINDIWSEKNQREDFFEARAVLEGASSQADEALTKFKEIKASGSFNTIPTELKQAMLAWEAMFDGFKTAFLGNADVLDVYNWRP